MQWGNEIGESWKKTRSQRSYQASWGENSWRSKTRGEKSGGKEGVREEGWARKTGNQR